jgi:hypothetical protein
MAPFANGLAEFGLLGRDAHARIREAAAGFVAITARRSTTA